MRRFNFIFSILVVLVSFSFHNSKAQTPSWKWVKWSNGTQTTARSIAIDASGNLYGTGSFNTQTIFDTSTLTATANAAFVVKYNNAGAMTWAKSIKNTAFGATDAKSIAVDGTGNIYVSGGYAGTITSGAKTLTGGDHYLAKFDNSGNIQWLINASGSNAVAADASGVYVAGGIVIQKFDALGTSLWTITGVKSNVGYTNFFSIAINSSGNVIAGGDIDDTWTFGTKLVTGGYQNIILMEVSAAGTVNWTKVLGGGANGGDHLQHLCLDPANNILITGKIGGACNFDAISLASKNGYLAKLSPTGTTKWAGIFTNTATIYGEGGIFVGSDPSGAAYVTGGYGTADVTNGAATKYITGIKNGGNAFVMKFDSTGVFKSALTNAENPIINNSRGMAVAGNASGVYFAGVCAPNSVWGTLTVSGYGSVFAKIDGSTSNGLNQEINEKGISIFPNPSNNVFQLSLSQTEFQFNDFKVINTSGQVVKAEKVTNNNFSIDLETYESGIYLLILNAPQGQVCKRLIRL